MARTTERVSSREQALQLMNDPNASQSELIRLYMCEYDKNNHRIRKELAPLLDDGELYTIHYKLLTQRSREKVARLFESRNKVMEAAREMEHLRMLVRSRINLAISTLAQWSVIETMETAVNMALLAVPEPDRSQRATQIANRIDLIGFSQTVEDGGLIHIRLQDIFADGDIRTHLEQVTEDAADMFAKYKGCHIAIMEYITENGLLHLLPVSIAILKEYEDAVAYYSRHWGWDKYNIQQVGIHPTNIDTTPTLQGLYGIIPDYDTIEPDKTGYNYMYRTYFSED